MSLVAKSVTFAYPGKKPVLDGITLEVEPGERVALSAPSGRGKTTLCRVLAGYARPQAGEVAIDGRQLYRREPRAGFTPSPRPVQLIWQHPEQAFDPLVRMRASLAEGLRAASSRHAASSSSRSADELLQGACAELCERFGIRRAWLDRFPHELSGGELMRFCIVRALIAEPRYLVCDEMTAMLDAVTQAELWREVVAIASERSMGIVLVSHSPALVDRVATRLFRLI